jgi:hypothetical protein
MPTPRRRPSAATGAFFFGALATLLLAGCASNPGRRESRAARFAAEPTLTAPRHVELGRVLSHDAANRTAVIEFVPHFRPNPFLAGTPLIARRLDTLEPTAHLVAAPYQSGRFLGAYVEEGTPGPGDEVVIAPAE